jgi:hypothetical protein
VIVCEGEKATEAVWKRNHYAVGTVCGAGVVPCDDALKVLVRFKTFLSPDNDPGGRQHMQAIGERLIALRAQQVFRIDWKDAPEHGDLADFEGDIDALLRSALRFEPAKKASEEAFSLVRADTESIEAHRWLWRDRLLLGKINNLQGDPGDGKSLLTMEIAARVSTGADFPDGSSCEAGNVIVLAGEDGLRDTIIGRLTSAGAALERIFVWAVDRKENQQPPTFPRDLTRLRLLIEGHHALLVIIDPLENFLDDKLDTNSNPSIRKALSALAWLAASTGACFLIIRHLSKDFKVQKAKYRGGGSIAITGAARSNWHAGPNPNDAGSKIFAAVKNNNSKAVSTLGCRIVEVEIKTPIGPMRVPRIEWLGVVEATADQSLASEAPVQGKRGPDPEKLQAACEFLREALSDGEYHDSDELLKQAQGQGIRRSTLWQAKERLQIKAKKRGFAGGWAWVLPST